MADFHYIQAAPDDLINDLFLSEAEVVLFCEIIWWGENEIYT